jgi:hypothetical protein
MLPDPIKPIFWSLSILIAPEKEDVDEFVLVDRSVLTLKGRSCF